MQKLVCCLIPLLVLGAPPFAMAQELDPEVEPPIIQDHEIEAARKLLRTERRLVLATELTLTPEESDAFWPLYNEYSDELKMVGDRKVQLITDFAQQFNRMTDQFANRALNESFAIDTAYQTIRERYRSKFKRILPIVKVARFYQIERKLDAVIDFQLAAQIPLIRPPE